MNYFGVESGTRQSLYENSRKARLATIDGAYSSFEEHDKGSIEPGKAADLVVLQGDPFVAAAEHWMDIKVQRTMLGGRWVFES
jgi:predicted amidohydrolase YtcJ